MPTLSERFTKVLMLAYDRTRPGTGAAFVAMLFVVDALVGPFASDEEAFKFVGSIFPAERAAFEEDGVFNVYAGRWGLKFPELN